MTINSNAIINYAVSIAASSGYFQSVNSFEPKNAPVGGGLTAAVWTQTLAPASGQSGLKSTTALMTLAIRLYTSMLAEPQDMIDPMLLDATDALMLAYSADFTFGDLILPGIDLLGRAADPMQADAGYVDIDRKLFRVMTITIPLIINDAWEQLP